MRLLVLILMRFEGEDRSLNSVQEIASDPKMLAAAAEKLCEMGGIPARLGNQLKSPVRQRTGGNAEQGRGRRAVHCGQAPVIPGQRVGGQSRWHAARFDPAVLLKPGTTLFLQIPPRPA